MMILSISNLFTRLFRRKVWRIRKLFIGLSGEKRIRIFVYGLDNAGKTTFLYKMWPDLVRQTPIIGINLDIAEYNISFTGCDLCHPADFRFIHFSVLRHFKNIQGIIFVVDSSDRDLISKAQDGLHLLLSHKALTDAVLLIFVSKQDLPKAMNVTEITVHLGLASMEKRKWYVQPTCAASGDGLAEGLERLNSEVKVKEIQSSK